MSPRYLLFGSLLLEKVDARAKKRSMKKSGSLESARMIGVD